MLVSKEEFEEGGHSACRNPLLQKMFVFIGVGEKGGSGVDTTDDNGKNLLLIWWLIILAWGKKVQRSIFSS